LYLEKLLIKKTKKIFFTKERQTEVPYTYFDVIAVHFVKRSFTESWYSSDDNVGRSE
jgi:hypothetical protein